MGQIQPHDSRVSSDAKETMDQCIVQFSMALTRAAMQEFRQDRCLTTITGNDLIIGFASLGLVDYVQPITEYLYLYHESHVLTGRL
jgi:histone H3/H4